MTTMNSNNRQEPELCFLLKKGKLSEFLKEVNEEFELLLPTEEDGVTLIKRYSGEDSIPEDYFNLNLPIRSLFLPPEEVLFKFSLKDDDYELQTSPLNLKERVIFGVRPCDLKSLSILDKVFESEEEDSFYLSKRSTTILIGLGCNNPHKSCFCTSFGVEPGVSKEADISLLDLGDSYLVEVFSKKGEKFIHKYLSLMEKAKEEDVVKGQNIKERVACSIPPVERGEVKQFQLEKHFERLEWQKISETCLGCGICTYLCPTCHCFDINDERWLAEGQRNRCWDSCMYSDFTLMASGHNPRPNKTERVRQRFMHKLCYFPNRYSHIACVGCGRCLKYCPVDIDITRIIGMMRDE